jgi:hypothetical protein
MSLERFNVLKSWSIVLTLAGAIGTSFVAMHRLSEAEGSIDELRTKQQHDHDRIMEIHADIRVVRAMLEQIVRDKKSASAIK